METVGVLFSGGLDSAAMIGHLLDRGHVVYPVYIQCGLPWEETEKYWAKRFLQNARAKRLKPMLTVRLLLDGAYKKNWSQTGATPGATSADAEVFLPARNLLLIVKALLALSSRNVFQLAIGTLEGNPFPDGKNRYFKALEQLLQQSFRQRIRILSPFRSQKKTDVLKQNVSYPLHLSFSCINPSGKIHCGICNKCAERRRAFRLAGVEDKTVYKKRSEI